MNFGMDSDHDGWGVEDSAQSKLEYDFAHGHYGCSKNRSGSGKGVSGAVLIFAAISILSEGLAGALTLLIIGAAVLLIYGSVYYWRHRKRSGK